MKNARALNININANIDSKNSNNSRRGQPADPILSLIATKETKFVTKLPPV